MPEPITKYRPYLSLAEITELIALIEEEEFFPSGIKEELQSARTSLLKTKTLAELNLASAAYTTNPRPTLSEKLGFNEPGTFVSMNPKRGAPVLTPTDLDAMMANLVPGLNIASSIEPTESTNKTNKEKPDESTP